MRVSGMADRVLGGVTLFLLIVSGGYAQVPDVVSGVPYRKMIRSKDGETKTLWLETIQNTSGSELEAFLAFSPCGSRGAVLTVHDARANFLTDRSVLPSESIAIRAAASESCSGAVDGAIFSDGRREGNAEALRVLFERRRGTFDALTDITDWIERSLESEQSSQELSAAVAKGLDKYLTNKQGDTALGYRSVVVVVTQVLERPERNVRTPSDLTASHQPTARDLVMLKGYRSDRAQREALMLRLEEWRHVLEGHCG
jgi:hypothetical protein